MVKGTYTNKIHSLYYGVHYSSSSHTVHGTSRCKGVRLLVENHSCLFIDDSEIIPLMRHPERTILEILGGQQQSAQQFSIQHIQALAWKLH
jgi:hypothetical protein